MDAKEFRQQAHHFADWMADYFENIETYPVKSKLKPGELIELLPERAPEEGEPMDVIFNDFQKLILPGITHWQSPTFFAYFPANNSFPSVLAEMLTATLGAQCMIWETSPAAAELEEQVLNWLKLAMNLPITFHGVIQDTASTATLTALLTAREKFSNYVINKEGYEQQKFRVYASTETHSSVEKAMKIAGLGRNSLQKIIVDSDFRMDTLELEKLIIKDIENGLKPLCVVATLGTTGSTAIDSVEEIAIIAKKYNLWLHIDAAYAGSALLLEEYQWMIRGIDQADSFVFNPHKWMFTNFDCSAYFVKDKEALIRTFSINPEYLKTKTAGLVNDYRDWGIQLGRRFRALKLWFVIRNMGIAGIKNKIREHIDLAKQFETWVNDDNLFEVMTPRTLSVVCFRYRPSGIYAMEEINNINEKLLEKLNASGKVFLTHTKLNGCYTLRMVIGQTTVAKNHVEHAWKLIQETSKTI